MKNRDNFYQEQCVQALQELLEERDGFWARGVKDFSAQLSSRQLSDQGGLGCQATGLLIQNFRAMVGAADVYCLTGQLLGRLEQHLEARCGEKLSRDEKQFSMEGQVVREEQVTTETAGDGRREDVLVDETLVGGRRGYCDRRVESPRCVIGGWVLR